MVRLERFIRFESNTVRAFLRGYPEIRRTPVLAEAGRARVEWVDAPVHVTNPSVARTSRGVSFSARTVTYRLSPARRSMVPLPGARPTVTYLFSLEEGGGPARPLHLELEQDERELEDARLFEWRGSLWCLWSESWARPDGRFDNAMVLGRVEADSVVELVSLRSPHGRAREKNWMPIVDGDRLLFMYDLARLEVYELVGGALRLIHLADEEVAALRGHSGSSQFVRYGDGWLGVSHQRLIRPIALPWLSFGYYRHSLVMLDERFELVGVTEPFFFSNRGIEFCAGFTVDAGEAIFSFGESDARAGLLRMSAEDLAAMLPVAALLERAR